MIITITGDVAMKEANLKIDTSKLREKANKDELKEAYEPVDRKDQYRIGAGARMEKPEQMTFFLEIVIPLFSRDCDLRLEELRSKINLLEKFEKSGYSLRCEKDNSIICEKNIAENEVEKEYRRSEELLKDSMAN